MLPLLIGGVSLKNKMGDGLDYFTPWTYAKTQGTVILHYLRLCFVPYPLCVDYDDWPRATSLLPGLVVAGLVGLAAWGTWRKRWWGYLGACFFLILAPTSSFIPLATEVAAERRMYLPALAVVIAFLAALGSARRLVLPALLLLAGTLTVLRNADYRTEETIWRDVVAKRPHNVRALINLAAISPADAPDLYARALQLAPDNAEAHYNYGVILAGKNQLDTALHHLQRAAELAPKSSLAQYQVAVLLAKLGKFPAAEAAAQRALALEPSSAKAQKLLHAIQASQ